jgi:hypothetical protein
MCFKYFFYPMVCSGDNLKVKLVGMADYCKIHKGELLPSAAPSAKYLNSICPPPEEIDNEMFDPYGADMWNLGT